MSEGVINNWYVLCTKPRNQRKVAERLSRAGYNIYCPVQKVCRQWSDRAKVLEEPLFKGYIFIQTEEAKREEVFNFPGVLRYLFWLRKPAVVHDTEIRTIQKMLKEHGRENIDVSDIPPGNTVRITSGPFNGEHAVLLDNTDKKVVVQLKELGLQLTLSLIKNSISL